MIRKNVLYEVIWIIAIALISLQLSYILGKFFGELYGYISKYITFYNIEDKSYFHFLREEASTFIYFPQIFFLLALIVYSIKELFKKYTRILPNVLLILLAAGAIITQVNYFLALIISVCHLQSLVSTNEVFISGGNVAIYPPLSDIPIFMSSDVFTAIKGIYPLMQYIFLPIASGFMIFLALRTGYLYAFKKHNDVLG